MKKTIQITIVLLISALSILGQTKETKLADTYFDNLSYVKAAKEYKKLSEKTKTIFILKRLGDSYYNNVQMKEAAEAYAQLFNLFEPQDTEYYFKYAQSLRSIGNFEESNLWMENFNKLNKDDSRGYNFINNKLFLSEIKDSQPSYIVTNLVAINTEFSDFGVTEFGNNIVFSSPRKNNVFVKRTHTRNDKNFLDLYKVSKDKINSKNVIPLFSKNVNSIYHESSATFTSDKKTMYFTRNNYNKGNFKTDKKGYNNLSIYKAEFIDDKWQNITELPFCNKEYSVGHPSLSKDGKLLYFTSDMLGGIGQTDIYVVDVNADGTFGLPKNLGITINTEGREMFPYIAEDNTLYFSSDGHFGIGALDVFASKSLKNEFQKPQNLKNPINTKLDDFAFSINPITKKGYLSSNREGGLGDDDIYAVEQIFTDVKDTVCTQVIYGIVKETKFKKNLPYATVLLKNTLGDTLRGTLTDELGKFSFKLPCSQKFAVTASKEYYKPDTKYFETSDNLTLELDLDFSLKITDDFTYNQTNELIIKINTIYFDYDKWNITPKAAKELDHIVEIMNKYPKIIVKSTSHTDSRGRESYNELLSQRRAESTVDYIIYKGIDPDRISGRGYGESRLTNKCVDNDAHTNAVKCTDEQHQANRRTSFVILNVDGTKINSEDKKTFQLNNKKEEQKEQTSFKTHIVSKNETLLSISKKYNLTVEVLKQINNLKVNNVYLNQVLIIDPQHALENTDVQKTSSLEVHIVKANETLYAIALQHNISLQKLKELNGLTSNNIFEGQELKLK